MTLDPSFRGTHPKPGALPFEPERLKAWLNETLPSEFRLEGELRVEQFKGGQSNPTYLLSSDHAQYVMRTKPAPQHQLLRSAHAIEREYRVMQALANTPVPVPQMITLCEDERLIGRAFYLMSHVPGRVFWEPALPGLTAVERRQVFHSMNQVLSDLHLVNVQAVGLADYGRAGNYFERQISRWSQQYTHSITQPIAEMDALMDWLPKHLPPLARKPLLSLVHGDFRLDNLIFDEKTLQVRAVLDWELSTLGHPLADLSYQCMAWHIEPEEFRGLAGLPLEALGIPSEREYIERYCQTTQWVDPQALEADWHFFLAYNLFRIAAILQGIAKRIEDGTASSEQAQSAAKRARPLAQNAWRHAQLHQERSRHRPNP
jgi:aminoglycoside phosphotransferase (APT) family kinase protein